MHRGMNGTIEQYKEEWMGETIEYTDGWIDGMIKQYADEWMEW